MQENETPMQPTPQPEKKAQNRDYLAPALVFIGLFFSFFVLITMQRLTRKVIDGQDMPLIPTSQPVVIMDQETSPAEPSKELTVEEQMELDAQMDTDQVGNDIVNDIDATTTTDVEGVYNENDLEDLEE
jgi:hypothetical protein